MTLSKAKQAEIDSLKKKLKAYKRFRIRALMVLYWLQTEFEKAIETTAEFNGVGFNSHDAKVLTPIAVKVIEALKKKSPNAPIEKRMSGLITNDEDKKLYFKMHKYAGQLLRIVNGEIPPTPEMKDPRYKLLSK